MKTEPREPSRIRLKGTTPTEYAACYSEQEALEKSLIEWRKLFRFAVANDGEGGFTLTVFEDGASAAIDLTDGERLALIEALTV